VNNLYAAFGLFTGSGLQGWVLCTFGIRFHCLLAEDLVF